jgi:hypothetical protein
MVDCLDAFAAILSPGLMQRYALALIPTGEPTSGTHCFRAKYLGIFSYVKNLQKLAKGQ